MVLFKESSLLFIMTEEISGGAYKLVIYLSQTSLLFGRLPVVCAAADKDILEGRSRGRNALWIYTFILWNHKINDKILLRFYNILKTTHFTLH